MIGVMEGNAENVARVHTGEGLSTQKNLTLFCKQQGVIRRVGQM